MQELDMDFNYDTLRDYNSLWKFCHPRLLCLVGFVNSKKINHYLEETISYGSFLLQSSPLHLSAYNNMSEYVPSFYVRQH